MRMLMAALMTTVLLACGGGGDSSPAPGPAEPPAPVPTGLLVPPRDPGEFVDLFRRSLPEDITGTDGQGNPGHEFSGAPALGLDGGSDGGFSTTYRLEAAVDEHDYVKYDGTHLYVAPTRGADCCFSVDSVAEDLSLLPPIPPDVGPRRIRILRTDAISASVVEAGAVELAEGQSVEGLYVGDGTLTALLSSAWWGRHGDAFASMVAWESQTVGLATFDVTDPAAPSLAFSLELDGALVASRRVDDVLVAVTRHLPPVPDLVYSPSTDQERAANRTILDNLTAAQLLPTIRINGEASSNYLPEQGCLIADRDDPLAPQLTGYPVITTVLRIDLAGGALLDALCYAEAADGVYLSGESLYLSQTVYDDPVATDTLVHRIDTGGALAYRGSGRVAGSLVTRGQPDFRMSDADGVLRLVTTRWQPDERDAFDHRLYTLALAGEAPRLEILAQLPAPGSEETIGKPNEDLFGVRFVGDRVYLVTFERIDPLYVIDLADPASPRILGELMVTGFSDLLHPVSASVLLGLGDDGEGRVKLELFDVADPAQPRSKGRVLLGEEAAWSYSQAVYDRRAFTYLTTGEDADRVAIPVSVTLESSEGYTREERLYMLDVQDPANPQAVTLMHRGYLTVNRNAPLETRPRSVLDGDAVFHVLGDKVWSAFWGMPDSTQGPI